MKRIPAKNVNEYIKAFPPKVRSMLTTIRKTIKATAPQAEEVISYGIAGYKYKGMLIYFAGFANHVSVYPAPRNVEAFKKELAAYKGGKGTVQFSVGKSIPVSLIKRIIKFRIKANEEKAALKTK
jgi:uncharacterized protein YdhG (YjbR/CyaY superfamily)